MSERVFVYGTLRRGASNAWRMRGARWHGAASVRGWLYELGWYPGLVVDAAGPLVHGDIFELAAGQLAALDEYEGCSGAQDDEYRRVRVEVRSAAGDELVWIYAWQKPASANHCRIIANGCWLTGRSPLGRPPGWGDEPVAAGEVGDDFGLSGCQGEVEDVEVAGDVERVA